MIVPFSVLRRAYARLSILPTPSVLAYERRGESETRICARIRQNWTIAIYRVVQADRQARGGVL